MRQHCGILDAEILHTVSSHCPALDRWPLTGVAQSPGQKGSQAIPHRMISCAKGGRGRGKKGGREASSTFLDREPQEPFQDKEVPQVDPGQGRARQGKAGQGRANPGHSSGPGKSHDCSVLLQVSQLLGRVEAAWGGGGEEEGSKQETTERASSLCSENTSRLRSPVGGCMCGNETGRGRESGKSKQGLLGCYPPTSPFLTHQPTPLSGERETVHKAPTPKYAQLVQLSVIQTLSQQLVTRAQEGKGGGGLGRGRKGEWYSPALAWAWGAAWGWEQGVSTFQHLHISPPGPHDHGVARVG